MQLIAIFAVPILFAIFGFVAIAASVSKKKKVDEQNNALSAKPNNTAPVKVKGAVATKIEYNDDLFDDSKYDKNLTNEQVKTKKDYLKLVDRLAGNELGAEEVDCDVCGFESDSNGLVFDKPIIDGQNNEAGDEGLSDIEKIMVFGDILVKRKGR